VFVAREGAASDGEREGGEDQGCGDEEGDAHRGGDWSGGAGYCWTTKRLYAGRSKTYRITVRALAGANGRTINRATASSSSANTTNARRTVRVLAAKSRGGGVTG
jgi:hypothetical protein